MLGRLRPTLILHDPSRLRAIAARHGPLQLLFAGKAHPRDDEGRALIVEIHRQRAALAPEVRILYIPGYDMALGALLTAGVDLWLNTPRAPLEASGTSGMKAAHNGVPNLSTRDGWWVEGCVTGHTGWAIEPSGVAESGADAAEADQLYRLLDQVVLPLYRAGDGGYTRVMRQSVELRLDLLADILRTRVHILPTHRDRAPPAPGHLSPFSTAARAAPGTSAASTCTAASRCSGPAPPRARPARSIGNSQSREFPTSPGCPTTCTESAPGGGTAIK